MDVRPGTRVTWGELIMRDGKAVVINRLGTVESVLGHYCRVRQDHNSRVPELPVRILRRVG
jgi:hypothetical protein